MRVALVQELPIDSLVQKLPIDSAPPFERVLSLSEADAAVEATPLAAANGGGARGKIKLTLS